MRFAAWVLAVLICPSSALAEASAREQVTVRLRVLEERAAAADGVGDLRVVATRAVALGEERERKGDAAGAARAWKMALAALELMDARIRRRDLAELAVAVRRRVAEAELRAKTLESNLGNTRSVRLSSPECGAPIVNAVADPAAAQPAPPPNAPPPAPATEQP